MTEDHMTKEDWTMLIRQLCVFYLGSMFCLLALAVTAIVVVSLQ